MREFLKMIFLIIDCVGTYFLFTDRPGLGVILIAVGGIGYLFAREPGDD